MTPARAAQARNTSIAAGNDERSKDPPLKIRGARGVMKERLCSDFIVGTTKIRR
jgi:hypothetical protein